MPFPSPILAAAAAAPSPIAFADALAALGASARKADRTRLRLQEAACRLLDRMPADTVRVADICAEAGVAHGTFYVYFQDLRHLLAETLRAFVDFLQATLHRAARSAGGDRVRETTAAYVALFEGNAGLMRCLVSRPEEFPDASDAFQGLNRDWTETVVEARLRQMRRAGQPAPPSREDLLRRAYALGGMVDQYLIMLLFGRDETLASLSGDREAMIDTLSLIWTRGMAP